MQLEVGAILEGKITGITKFGAFVELGEGKTGMVHISEVKVLSVGEDGKISLSMKKAMETVPASGQNTQRTRSGRKGPDHFEWSNKKNEATSFEDMLNKFKQSSDEKMSALKKGLESKRGGFSRHGSGQSR